MIEFTSWDDPVIGFQVEPFNWRLRKARQARGWSRAELARRAGVQPSTVGDAEKLRYVSANVREKLAFVLLIPEDELFPGVIDALPQDGPGEIEIPFTEQQVEHWRQTGRFAEDETLAALVDRGGLREALTAAMGAALPPRQQRLLALRFGLGDGSPRTLDEAAGALGVTRERVRQLEADALRRLRQRGTGRLLRETAGIDPGRETAPRSDASPFQAWVEQQASDGRDDAHVARSIRAYDCCKEQRTPVTLRRHLAERHEMADGDWALYDRLTGAYRLACREPDAGRQAG